MVEVVFNGEKTSIRTNDLHIYAEGSLEIKKEGAGAPIIKLIEDNHQKIESTDLNNIPAHTF